MKSSAAIVDIDTADDSSSNVVFQDSSSTPLPPASNDMANYAFGKMRDDMAKIEKRIAKIESQQISEKKYYDTASKVNNSMFFAVLFILLVFVMLQIAVIVLLYVFFADDTAFIERVKIIVNGLGLLGLVEILALPVYLRMWLVPRIERLENDHSR